MRMTMRMRRIFCSTDTAGAYSRTNERRGIREEIRLFCRSTAPGTRSLYVPQKSVTPDGKLFSGDGGDEEMVAHAKDEKWIIFRSNMHGEVHTYMAEVARACS